MSSGSDGIGTRRDPQSSYQPSTPHTSQSRGREARQVPVIDAGAPLAPLSPQSQAQLGSMGSSHAHDLAAPAPPSSAGGAGASRDPPPFTGDDIETIPMLGEPTGVASRSAPHQAMPSLPASADPTSGYRGVLSSAAARPSTAPRERSERLRIASHIVSTGAALTEDGRQLTSRDGRKLTGPEIAALLVHARQDAIALKSDVSAVMVKETQQAMALGRGVVTQSHARGVQGEFSPQVEVTGPGGLGGKLQAGRIGGSSTSETTQDVLAKQVFERWRKDLTQLEQAEADARTYLGHLEGAFREGGASDTDAAVASIVKEAIERDIRTQDKERWHEFHTTYEARIKSKTDAEYRSMKATCTLYLETVYALSRDSLLAQARSDT